MLHYCSGYLIYFLKLYKMKKSLFYFILACFFLSCQSDKKEGAAPVINDSLSVAAPTPENAAPRKTDTVSSFKTDNFEMSAKYFTAPSGITYKMEYLDPNPEELKEEESKAAMNCSNNYFDGTDRKISKISLVSGNAKSYTTLVDFLSSLKSDDDMIALEIPRTAGSNRVTEEKKNVKLSNIFLFAIKRESDNDYHMIIGDKKGHFFNVECSGLPTHNATDYPQLEAARTKITEHFSEMCSAKYAVFESGIPIEVTGSIFFDVDHKAGVIGPEGYRPKTAWEVHPMSNIVFN